MTKKKVINEEKTSDELKEEFFDAKEDKESIVGKIISILLWIVLLAWIAVCVVDYFKTLDEYEIEEKSKSIKKKQLVKREKKVVKKDEENS